MKRYIKSFTTDELKSALGDNYPKGGYLYIFKHGIGPGTIPDDVKVVKVKDLPNYYTAVWLDRFLTTPELKQYDIPDETRITELLNRIGYCQKNGDVVPCDDVEACGDINCSTDPNSPDVDKMKLVRQVIKQAKEIRDYFQSHNNNLNRKQEQYLEDLSDGIDNESVAAIREAIENMKYNSKNLRSEQYNLIMNLYDKFNLAGGKFGGMGYPEDDEVNACGDIKASTNDSNIVNKIYSVMMDYEYGYDPDMTDINAMLQELTSEGVHVDTSDAFKKAWVSAHNKVERKTWGGSGDSYHYDSLTPSELEAIENYDTEYWEYVKDHPFNLKPASITSSAGTKYLANMVSASDDGYEQLAEGDDAESEEYIEYGKYYVAGYLQSNCRGLMDDLYSDDFEEILSTASDMAGQGLYVEITNRADGRSKRYTPEDFEEAASYGEYPDHIREDLAL